MDSKKSLAFFEDYQIRRIFDEKKQEWFFSVVDVVRALTQHPTHRGAASYWKVLKGRLKREGSQLVTNCYQLKLMSPDGKEYLTDVANAETLLRLVQSIPSPKAEPLKLWLAKVGHERLKDMADPALSLDRAREYWLRQGRSEKWVQQRMMGQETRNKLTDYWKNHEIKGEEEYALLTDLIHREWAEVSVKDHKQMKGLKTQNLRDHMTEAELIFTALAELSTRQIAESDGAIGLEPNKRAGQKGGGIARKARLELEDRTGRNVVTEDNFLPPKKDLEELERKGKGTEKRLGIAKGLPKSKKRMKR
jgi:DNA-damage-inducible protein D